MSRNYSFDMWVPRDCLFEALSIIARHDGTDELAPLIWPDGRRLPISAKPRANNARDLAPFDGSLDESFCLSFCFEEDEPLHIYNQIQMAHSRQEDEEIWDYQQQNGLYKIGCIWTRIHQNITQAQWLEGQLDLVFVSFMAATSSISDLFAESQSIQKWFIALAREIGAFSCELNYELSSSLLFIEGDDIDLEEDDNSSEDYDINEEGFSLSFWHTYLTRHPESEPARKICMCERFNATSSAHERMEVHLCLHDANSGVRAKALKAIVEVEKEAASEFVETATNDPDWRIRALATYLFGYYGIQCGVPLLERMLFDVHAEVRIAATLSLGRVQAAFDVLLNILLSTSATSENLGLIRAALYAEIYFDSVLLVSEALEVTLERDEFPFKNTAIEKLNTLRSLTTL